MNANEEKSTNVNNQDEMNFIYDLDEAAANTDMKYIFRDVVFDVKKRNNTNFLLRKDTNPQKSKTRILYIKDNVRVRFSDNDVLEMIMSIEEKHIVQNMLQVFKEVYSGKYDTLLMRMGEQEYKIPALPVINYDKILKNRKDISISFDDLYALINLIIAKDIASTAVIGKMDYLKRTLSKYILVIGRYYFDGKAEEDCFQRMGIDFTGDFYTDFESGENADANIKKIIQYKMFDSFNII